MDTSKLKKFAQFARSSLIEQVGLKLDSVLTTDSLARRESTEAVKTLEKAIADNSREHVIERVAYIWFNRFCALRFMDVNRYTRVGVVSPAEGQFQPEILAEAKMGHIDEDMVPAAVRQEIQGLLSGRTPSRDSQGEAYRLLVVAACRDWHRNMPFLFQHIDDYTELLLPDDLLSENSILAYTREAMTPDACESVEVIGWLYQFYISEKKDQIFDGLKKNQKITPSNIPAATQLFTPHWIVRYLVQNSLGRLWLLNRPQSRLADQMEYYIPPEQPETDFLKINGPEDIKVCDPACGSGHMLTYAFDLLYDIYEEEGYDPSEIPENILTHNLYGIELDERAGELAAFALTMKARERQRRFFNKGIRPNVCVLENVEFDDDVLTEYMAAVGNDLFTQNLRETLQQFSEADNFGSLITPKATNLTDMLATLAAKDMQSQLFLAETHQRVLTVLRMAEYLSPRYAVVVTNPPYMGSGGMNYILKSWAKDNYPGSKSDTYAMFIERALSLTTSTGYSACITIQNWMYQSTYEELRLHILKNSRICGLIQIGYNSFPELNSKVALGSAFVLRKGQDQKTGEFFNLNDASQSSDKGKLFLSKRERKDCYIVSSDHFRSIPGYPIAYQASEVSLRAFERFDSLKNIAKLATGIIAGDNEKYIRSWQEVCLSSTSIFHKDQKAVTPKWFPLLKGGDKRKWFGNLLEVIDFQNNGSRLRASKNAMLRNEDYYFREGIHWNRLSGGAFYSRKSEPGCIFEDMSPSLFKEKNNEKIIAFLNSKVGQHFLLFLSAGWKIEIGQVGGLPINLAIKETDLESNAVEAIEITKSDWDSYEVSWNFTTHPLLHLDSRSTVLKLEYKKLSSIWFEATQKLHSLEEENNRIFIEAYGLQDELTPEVPLKEITLTCNPHYRYGGDKTDEELEALLLADTMREFISYAVGCMFGRYSLDKPGLILANQSETLADYLAQIPEPTFTPDKDNVIPILDGDWFADDITERFRRFLRVTFGDEHYEENLRFIEEALNIKGKRNYSLRDYFLSEFYTDHLKRYKKRPIYWLFSSPKGSFNALIYMHRYRPDTVSVVLNDYLREFRAKLLARKNHLEALGISSSASQAEKTKALKEVEKISKMIAEVDAYERDTLYPLATQQLEIDLDDGVKANYPRFGAALKKIPGLEAKDD
ncbi:BREX-1 system adenine-specific DNA-methyltransferase PglX [Pusillimonas sp.]|uniref:BREX-1 system adenine-specific DNA-methyltransferase PglX n=1 Tax=Pusillimonas sp. TaxID=3040095 RepID=UPI0029A7AC50|nr:BREX-1 system adenine-specific DNA-methyltransferase PglX [Pusillimonas sp.]MDX3894401.1 BREX-1 system adenine-specific DNA-methyltransferase PglX [Pusillimonas sp.]